MRTLNKNFNFAITAFVMMLFASCNNDQKVNETEKVDRYETLIDLSFPGAYPSEGSTEILRKELAFQRGVQTYLWALPAMNMYAMREGQRAAFSDNSNVLMIAKDRIDYNLEYPTGNPDVIYAFAWLDLKKEGPTVLDMPANLQGLLDDMWHRPITDIGAIGPDKNQGGKYLILPPNYNEEVPEGYFTFKSSTYGVFVFLRSFLIDGKTEPGVALLEQTNIYPLSKTDNPPKMEFPNLSGVNVSGDFPRDIEYFERLAEFINYETVNRNDFAMRGMLAEIGIVKGQSFNPNEKLKNILNTSANVGYKMATDVSFNYNGDISIYEDRNWQQVFIGGSPIFEKETYLDFDARIAFFHKAYGTSNGMVLAMPGKGSQYLAGYKDLEGNFLTGENSYHVYFPANVPVANYWSIVLYDADTRGLLNNGEPFPSIASNQEYIQNEDGSTDIYFGPEKPKGKPVNWIKTVPNKGYILAVRLFSPTQAYFDQTWRPDDIEKVNVTEE